MAAQPFDIPEGLAPADHARIEELYAGLSAGLPRMHAAREFIVRQYAIAMWRSENCVKLESSLWAAAETENTDEPVPLRLAHALMRDAEGNQLFNKLLRFQAQAMKELHIAAKEYNELLACIPPRPLPVAVEAPATVPTQTPRNAQCPCGSGVKFKRCCGAVPSSVPAPVLHAGTTAPDRSTFSASQ